MNRRFGAARGRLAGHRQRGQSLLRPDAGARGPGHAARRSGRAWDSHREVRHDVSARAALRRASSRAGLRPSWWSRRSAASSNCSCAKRCTTQPQRPAVIGKEDADGAPLVPATGELDPDRSRACWPSCSGQRESADSVWRGWPLTRSKSRSRRAPHGPRAFPNFCSGCPHNRSTLLLEGQMAGGGIGCHAMAMQLRHPDRGFAFLTQMGGEGAPWIGMAPFVERAAHFSEHRRRHVLPLRLAGGGSLHRGGRQHHLQDSLQRRTSR